jgi:hypothetical protein
MHPGVVVISQRASRSPGFSVGHRADIQLDTALSRLGLAELELELIQTHMAQKPLLWVEVGAHAVRNRSKCGGVGWAGAGVACLSRLGLAGQGVRPRPHH